MRIHAVQISNYRGIRTLNIRGLSSSPVVTLSGKNGVGKSLLLEAIALAWTGRFGDHRQLIGPWSDETEIHLELELTQDETNALADYAASFDPTSRTARPNQFSFGVILNKKPGTISWTGQLPWADWIRSDEFRALHPFAQIDLIPADRPVARNSSASINLGTLGEKEARNYRVRIAESMSRTGRQEVSLSGVVPFLASLDYLELIAVREGRVPPNDFELITSSFEMATGKRVLRPTFDGKEGAQILVETAEMIRHEVRELSSGEQEILSLMYLVRRLSAQGGILLIDEPELHLHPALQRSFFSIIQTVADRAQIWIATHSPKLVTPAPTDAILHVLPPSAQIENQIRRAVDEQERELLFDDLGVNPIELLQNDVMLVVEGETDENYLQSLFPLELGRAVIYKAGSAKGVERVCEALSSSTVPLPWLAVRDRDLLTESEMKDLQDRFSNLFIWRQRTLENHFLDAELIAATLERTGQHVMPHQVWKDLAQIADKQKEQVALNLIRNELNRLNSSRPGKTGDFVTDLHSEFEAQRIAAIEKQNALPETAADVLRALDQRWLDEWPILAQGKQILGAYAGRTPVKVPIAFIRALCKTCNDLPDLMPKAFKDFQQQLQLALSSTKINDHSS